MLYQKLTINHFHIFFLSKNKYKSTRLKFFNEFSNNFKRNFANRGEIRQIIYCCHPLGDITIIIMIHKLRHYYSSWVNKGFMYATT